MIYKLLLFLALNAPLFLFAQKMEESYLSGIVTNANNRLPVVGLIIYTEFTEARTDNLGRYNLSLSQCGCGIGDKIKIHTYSNEYGSSPPLEYTLSNESKQIFDFSIFKTPISIYANGIIRDEINKQPLKGIEITVISESSKNLTTLTQSDGIFQIPIPKSLIKQKETARLVITDPENRYYQNESLQSIKSFIKINLRRNPEIYERTNKDPRAQLNELGVLWKYDNFKESVLHKDLRIIELFAKGGMKIRKEDFFDFYSTNYDNEIINLLNKYESITCDICPFDLMVNVDWFYSNIPLESQKASQILRSCSCEITLKKLDDLISKERSKIEKFKEINKHSPKKSKCLDEFELESDFTFDDVFYSLYDEAAQFNLLSYETNYGPSKHTVISKLNANLLLNIAQKGDESILYMKQVIYDACPKLYLLLEIDDLYLRKLLHTKELLKE